MIVPGFSKRTTTSLVSVPEPFGVDSAPLASSGFSAPGRQPVERRSAAGQQRAVGRVDRDRDDVGGRAGRGRGSGRLLGLVVAASAGGEGEQDQGQGKAQSNHEDYERSGGVRPSERTPPLRFLYGVGGRQRERQRLAVGAGAQRLVGADRLLEGDRHRVVGHRRVPGRLRERDLQRLGQRERAVGQPARSRSATASRHRRSRSRSPSSTPCTPAPRPGTKAPKLAFAPSVSESVAGTVPPAPPGVSTSAEQSGTVPPGTGS